MIFVRGAPIRIFEADHRKQYLPFRSPIPIFLTLKDRDSRPRLKITIVLKCLITVEPLILSECKSVGKAEILRFSEISHVSQLDMQRLRSVRDYVITF